MSLHVCKSLRVCKSLHACKSRHASKSDLSRHMLAPHTSQNDKDTPYQKMDANACNMVLELRVKVMEVDTRAAEQCADGYHAIIKSFVFVVFILIIS